jgi:hypothetical protein
LLGAAPEYDIDTVQIYRVMVKILRGLLYHETGLTVPHDYVIKWNVINEPLPLPVNIFNTLKTCPIHSFGNGIFRYQVHIHPGTGGSFWLLSLFDGAMFHGVIYPDRSSAINEWQNGARSLNIGKGNTRIG